LYKIGSTFWNKIEQSVNLYISTMDSINSRILSNKEIF
jgi:hypothetical protein